MDVAADIRVGARHGLPGTWLVDPVNVAIVNQAEFDATPDDETAIIVSCRTICSAGGRGVANRPHPSIYITDFTIFEIYTRGRT